MNKANRDCRVYSDPERLAAAAAEMLQTIITAAVAARGRCSLAISGGTTPRLLYEILSQPRFQAIPWDCVGVFWSDERFVWPEHAASNYRMACEALLDRLPVKPHIFPVNTKLPTPQLAAENYEMTMRRWFGTAVTNGWPQFDCVLLGLGADGHTASLFPGDKAVNEKNAWAAAAQAPDRSYRITLTLPVINAADKIIFLVSGQEKAGIVSAVAGGIRQDLPAAMVKTTESIWLLDAPAASALNLS